MECTFTHKCSLEQLPLIPEHAETGCTDSLMTNKKKELRTDVERAVGELKVDDQILTKQTEQKVCVMFGDGDNYKQMALSALQKQIHIFVSRRIQYVIRKKNT